MDYLRAYVTPIKMHMDPTALIVRNEKIVVAYGMTTSDLSRIKNNLPNLNKCGLIVVNKKNDNFRFLVFKRIIVGIFPGFKEVCDETGLPCSYDFQFKDISKIGDYHRLSKWITLKKSERLDAENRASISTSAIRKTRLWNVLGSDAIEIIEDLMWATDVFEPLHAVTTIAGTEPIEIEISSLENNLRNIGADLRYIRGSPNRILDRKKSNVTLMDCAKFLFPTGDYYFKSKSSELSKTLRMPEHKLPPHFRGYLIVDENYLEKLREASIRSNQ